MNREQFKKIAEETGANKCVNFDWTNNVNNCCSDKNAPHSPNFCVMFSLGVKCEHYKDGI